MNDLFGTPLRAFLARCIAIFMFSTLAACSTSETLNVAAVSGDSNYAAIVLDARSGKVLYSAHADEVRYPASLAKMMTLYLLFDGLRSGQYSKSSLIPISAYAAGRPASKLYLKEGSTITVDAAIRALVVKSANDVASAVAEFIGGTEANFAAMMTAKGRALGMRSTVFTNASGLPDRNMRSTARDLALLSMALKRNHGAYYSYFRLTSFTHEGKTVSGHNQVLVSYKGADGLKTGYTRASGFNLATSASRRNRSVIAIVLGGDSARARDTHMMQLLDAALK